MESPFSPSFLANIAVARVVPFSGCICVTFVLWRKKRPNATKHDDGDGNYQIDMSLGAAMQLGILYKKGLRLASKRKVLQRGAALR